MNVAEVRELFDYNAWANRRMFGALAALPEEQYQRDVKCSFGSIHGTLAHIVGAEQLWLARWRGRQPGSGLKGGDVGSLAGLRTIWEGVEADRARFLGDLTGGEPGRAGTVESARAPPRSWRPRSRCSWSAASRPRSWTRWPAGPA